MGHGLLGRNKRQAMISGQNGNGSRVFGLIDLCKFIGYCTVEMHLYSCTVLYNRGCLFGMCIAWLSMDYYAATTYFELQQRFWSKWLIIRPHLWQQHITLF